MKEIVTNTVETNTKFDKIQELLTNDGEDNETVEEQLSELLQNQPHLLKQSTKFLKQYNRVSKYEKVIGDKEFAAQNKKLEEEGKLANRTYDEMRFAQIVVPLVNQTVNRNKKIVKLMQEAG